MPELLPDPQVTAPVESRLALQWADALSWLLYPIAFFLRLRNVNGVFTPFGTFPLATDSYYHLRRILLTANTFPHVPDTDRYVNFPVGAATHWPFGFDFIYAAVARATCPGPLDDGWIIAMACLLTPLIGAATPCLAYRIGKGIGGIRVGLYAGLIVAAAETVIVLTSVGYIDHHVFESFWTGVALWLWLPVLSGAPVTGRRAGRAFTSGLAVGAGMICATVLPLLVPLVGGALAVTLWRARRDPARFGHLMLAGAWHWAGAAIFLTPFVATRLAEPSGVNPSLGAVWLAVFGLSGGMFFWVGLRASRWFGERSPWLFGALIGWGLLALLALPRLAFREIGEFIVYGVGHVVATDPWLATISESQPVFGAPLKSILSGYTGVFFIFPLLLAWSVSRLRTAAPDRLALTALAGATFGLALVQWKFSGLFIVPFAVLSGHMWTEAGKWMADRWPARADVIRAGTTAAFLGLLLPGLHYRVTYVVLPGNVFVDLYPTLQWMATRTPPTSPRGDAPTDYAVIADWNAGHWVVWFAGRPVVSSPLGHTLPMRIGIRDGAAILARPPLVAEPLLRARRGRYVLIAPMLLNETVINAYWDERTGRTSPVPSDGSAAPSGTLYAYLLLGDGVPGEYPQGGALRHFRLVHESQVKTVYPGMNEPSPAAKVFEYVAGARLRGRIEPNGEVRVQTRLRSGTGREFDYFDLVRADAQGNFECILPYAQGKQAFSDVVAIAPYTVTAGGGAARFEVTEAQVLSGGNARMLP